jgi:putative hydrolase of the HAD superfamily
MAYVGDTLSRDVLGCRNAGIPLSIQIQNPAMAFRDAGLAETGLAADAVIRDLAEIPGIIQAYNSKCRP